MNCAEFEHVLPDYLEGTYTFEQQAHLKSCPVCSDLLADLNFIASQAGSLRAMEEPSPRVWNAIEIQLRREGIIRHPQFPRPSLAEFFHRWRAAWLVPVAAALAIVAGLKLYRPTSVVDGPVAKQVALQQKPAPRAAEDTTILDRVAARPPAQRASYRANLDSANAFIRDAEESVKNDPNDAYSRQLLMNAYEQKQMLYDLAVDRSEGEQ
jgi:hypothetical protein